MEHGVAGNICQALPSTSWNHAEPRAPQCATKSSGLSKPLMGVGIIMVWPRIIQSVV